MKICRDFRYPCGRLKNIARCFPTILGPRNMLDIFVNHRFKKLQISKLQQRIAQQGQGEFNQSKYESKNGCVKYITKN
jgi:hypothetical protein